MIVANAFLEIGLEKLRAAVSPGYARGLLPRDVARQISGSGHLGRVILTKRSGTHVRFQGRAEDIFSYWAFPGLTLNGHLPRELTRHILMHDLGRLE